MTLLSSSTPLPEKLALPWIDNFCPHARGSPTGLLSDLSLFSYTWDISGFDITATDTFGGGGQSSVGDPVSVSVPESSNSLSLILLGIVGTVLMGKRKVKS